MYSSKQNKVIKESALGAHLFVESCAGSGKSTTIKGICEHNKHKKILVVMFNEHNEKETKKKLGKLADVSTFHKLGNRFLKANGIQMRNTLWNALKTLESQEPKYKTKTTSLYETVKMLLDWGLKEYSAKYLKTAIPKYNPEFEITVPLKRLSSICNFVMQNVIDFNSMLGLPVRQNLISCNYDLVIVDEVQDLNEIQIEFLKKLNPKQFIFLGDRYQSIYAFRGSVDAVNSICNQWNPKILPLDITYRCPSNIVSYVNSRLQSKMVAHKKGGFLEDYRFDGHIPECDLLIACTNLTLLKSYIYYHDHKIAATFKGTNLWKPLDNKISNYNSLDELLTHCKNQLTNPFIEDKTLPRAIIYLVDHYDLKSVTDIREKIQYLSKSDKGTGINCATVWATKGLEADTVVVVEDWFDMPAEQTVNAKYVAFTRAKVKLTILATEPKCLRDVPINKLLELSSTLDLSSTKRQKIIKELSKGKYRKLRNEILN